MLRNDSTDPIVERETAAGYHRPPAAITPRTVLDLGCNIGLTLADYEQLWPEALIVGVEMDPGNAATAGMNAGSEIVCAAVAADRGFRRYSTDGGEYAYRLDTGGQWLAAAVTLADLLELVGGTADFVKMDIEGGEWEVLPSPGWADRVGAVLVELHPQTEESVERAAGLLEAAGFAVSRHRPHPAALWATRGEQ